jgi:ketosteroid isomerase-like protein
MRLGRSFLVSLRGLLALVGFAIGFALPTFAQQTNTPDPQLREQLDALDKKDDEAFNAGNAAALAALYTEDAIEVTDQGPIYGRKAIEKHFGELFQNVHFSNYIVKADQYSPHILGTAGTEAWSNGEWSATISATIQGETFGPVQLKGYWSAIRAREGDVWKTRVLTLEHNPSIGSNRHRDAVPGDHPEQQIAAN